jgi:3-phosphoshikimate 1-carboxyvinyltransferase
LDSSVSSQFITALILIGPSLKKGLTINLSGKITSKPYIEMSLSLLNRIGVQTKYIKNRIEIKPFMNYKKNIQKVESDWSSLSYFYSIVALSNDFNLDISSFFTDSLQGDKRIISIYNKLGVKTIFNNGVIKLIKKKNFKLPKKLILDLNDTPDLAQTISVTCFGLGISCDLYGLKTLKIKETDRLIALKNEFEKLGAITNVTNQSFHLKKQTIFNSHALINTYEDHRMAMAFTPLAVLKPIGINDPNVISKSFPDFWSILDKLNFKISEY